MNTYRLSGLLLIPLLIAALWVSYLVFWDGSAQAAFGYLPILIGFVFLMVFKTPIDWWWFNKHPPQLEESVKERIDQRLELLRDLNPDERELFFRRVALYVEGRAFEGQGFDEDIPYDIRCMIASFPVLLTFGTEREEDYLMDPYLRIIIYKHPFLSPQFPDDVHISEIHPEDGVIIFSMEQLLPGLQSPSKFLDIAAYEYSRAIRTLRPGRFDLEPEPRWLDIERITSWKRKKICAYYGFDEMDLHALAIVAYLSVPEDFRAFRPDWEEQILSALGMSEKHSRAGKT